MSALKPLDLPPDFQRALKNKGLLHYTNKALLHYTNKARLHSILNYEIPLNPINLNQLKQAINDLNTPILQAIKTDNIQICLKNGRHFILNNGQSVTMKQITNEVSKVKDIASSDLVGRAFLLELQGKAKLAKASRLTRFRTFFHQLFGNLSLKQNVHLQKLDSFLLPITLTPEQKKLANDLIKQLNDLRAKSKNEYEKHKSHVEIQFALNLTKTHPQFSKLHHYAQIHTNRLKAHEDKYKDIKLNDEDGKIFTNLDNLLLEIDKFDDNAICAILKQVGEFHPWIVMKILANQSAQDQLAVLSQIRNLQPFLLKFFKENEYYL